MNSSTMMTSALVSVLDHVIAVALVEHVGAQGLLHVVVVLDVGGIVEIAEAQQLLALGHALFGEAPRLLCFSSMV